jgi:hypothetical protein
MSIFVNDLTYHEYIQFATLESPASSQAGALTTPFPIEPDPCALAFRTAAPPNLAVPSDPIVLAPNLNTKVITGLRALLPYEPRQRQRRPLSTPLTMAAAVKALNAKIRSNKYLDYFCSTRMYTPKRIDGRSQRARVEEGVLR